MTVKERVRLEEPLVVLSYPYSGVGRLGEALGQVPELEWISTDLTRVCSELANAWLGVEDRDQGLSQLAKSSIRSVIRTMITTRLASTTADFWCMPGATDGLSTARFAAIYPKAKFICLHRDPLDMMYNAIAANPWGLDDTSVSRFVSAQAGNHVAATAAYWVHHSNRIMQFEQEYPERAIRIRYEDFCATSDAVVSSLISFAGLPQIMALTAASSSAAPAEGEWNGADSTNAQRRGGRTDVMTVGCGAALPRKRIPQHLRDKMKPMMAQLGYQSLDRRD